MTTKAKAAKKKTASDPCFNELYDTALEHATESLKIAVRHLMDLQSMELAIHILVARQFAFCYHGQMAEEEGGWGGEGALAIANHAADVSEDNLVALYEREASDEASIATLGVRG